MQATQFPERAMEKYFSAAVADVSRVTSGDAPAEVHKGEAENLELGVEWQADWEMLCSCFVLCSKCHTLSDTA